MPTSALALLVIDLQRGAFDGVRCPPIDRATELLANARTLIDAARASGMPVVFIQHCDDPGQAFEHGTPHWEVSEALAPLPTDAFVSKHASSAFENTGLASVLTQFGASELLLCGLQSEFCVCNTAKAALDLGYTVHLADDGHGTWPSNGRTSQQISSGVNDQLAALGAVLESTAGLAARLRR